MMRMRTKPTVLPPGIANGGGERGGHEWEMRPGGMLVQKRNADSDQSSAPPPIIRVRVKYGSVYHEINIKSQATFGELKRMLAGPTGLHHEDMKLMYKDKERDSKAYLDLTGVKDRSKMVLLEDPLKQEKRLLEMRKNLKTEKAAKAISEISLEIDRLAGQVSALETIINKGGRVEEKNVINLIELLMNQLLKLDAVMADGDVKLQRKTQVKRVQSYVETLDMLKVKNSKPPPAQSQHHREESSGQRGAPPHEQPLRYPIGQRQTLAPEDSPRSSFELLHIDGRHNESIRRDPLSHRQRRSSTAPVVVTTKWETFDSTPAPSTSASSSGGANDPVPQRFKWEFFD